MNYKSIRLDISGLACVIHELRVYRMGGDSQNVAARRGATGDENDLHDIAPHECAAELPPTCKAQHVAKRFCPCFPCRCVRARYLPLGLQTLDSFLVPVGTRVDRRGNPKTSM